MTLDEIGIKYKTDKASYEHDYLNTYDRYIGFFKNKPINLLEIGIQAGNSLKMWQEYFHKDSKICGIDSEFVYNNIYAFTGNQTNRAFLESIIDKLRYFDIIIDDGGHTMEQQQTSFGYLFKYLSKNGVYIIEDLHTSYSNKEKFNKYFNTTTLNMLNNLTNTQKIQSDFILKAEKQYIEDNYKHCMIERCKQSEIGFIAKGELEQGVSGRNEIWKK